MEKSDAAIGIMMELLAELRSKGLKLQVQDIDSILPRVGVEIESNDHFMLVMADFELQKDTGAIKNLQDFIDANPKWKTRIEEYFYFIKKIAPLGTVCYEG